MADSSVAITAGSGTNVSTRTNASGEHMQVIMLGVDGSDSVLAADASNGLPVFVTVLPSLPAGTNNIGDVDILSLPALPSGSNVIGGVTQSGTWTVGLSAGTNTNEIVGDVAHDSAIGGNPVRIGGRALSADYTAVATGDTADLVTSLLGKLVTLPYALPGATWNYAAPAGGLVSTTAVTIKSATASKRHYITHIDVVNSHQTISTELVINDGAGGTALWRGWLQAAGGGYSINFDPPLRGSVNTLLEIDEVTATGTAGVVFNCTGYTAEE